MPTTLPTAPAGWTPEQIIGLIMALVSLITALAALHKQIITRIEGRQNAQRIDTLHGQMETVRKQVTDVALQVPPPSPIVPGGLTDAQVMRRE